MNKITAFINKAKTIIAVIKVEQMLDLNKKYWDVADQLARCYLPTIVKYYRTFFAVIVQKTYEKPEVAINLIRAVENVLLHYGPAIKEVVGSLNEEMAKINADGKSPAMNEFLEAMESMMKTIKETTAPVAAPDASEQSDEPFLISLGQELSVKIALGGGIDAFLVMKVVARTDSFYTLQDMEGELYYVKNDTHFVYKGAEPGTPFDMLYGVLSYKPSDL